MHRIVSLILLGSAATAAFASESPARPVSTYSIVALDAEAGEMGVAVQSHWFSVGGTVPWAEPGVGVVATQSFVRVDYGPLGLEAMARGESPEAALKRLVSEDPQSAVRQVAFLDARGRVAAHTGKACIPGAGHRTGAGYSVQANLMLTDDVPEAMARAFEASTGPLAERMLAALEAAQAAGGDIRGRQSAAVVVVSTRASARPWTDRRVDLRVEDHRRPLAELRRLLELHRAYEWMNRGDEAMAEGRMAEALEAYAAAEARVPDNDEFVFWHAFTLATNGRLEDSLPVFERAFRMNPAWVFLLPRLVRAGHMADDPELMGAILGRAPVLRDLQALPEAKAPASR